MLRRAFYLGLPLMAARVAKNVASSSDAGDATLLRKRASVCRTGAGSHATAKPVRQCPRTIPIELAATESSSATA